MPKATKTKVPPKARASKVDAPAVPKPVAAYLRVSSKGQTDASQREAVAGYLARHGFDPEQVGWYTDTASGRTLSRPAFDRLQRDIFDGHVKTVIVFKVDRVARRLREGLEILCSWCDQGIRFISTTQQIEVTGAMGRTVAALLLGLAELELEYRRDRQTAGIAAARKAGRYIGRAKGTTKGTPERARALRSQGLQVSEIATALGVSDRTVFRYLRDGQGDGSGR